MMQEEAPGRQLTFHKPEGSRCAGRRTVRYLDSVEEDLRVRDVTNWRRESRIGIDGGKQKKRSRCTRKKSKRRRKM